MQEQRTKKKHKVVEGDGFSNDPTLVKSESRAKQLPEEKRVEYRPDDKMVEVLKGSNQVTKEIIALLNELLAIAAEARQSELGTFGDGAAEQEDVELSAINAVPEEFLDDLEVVLSTPDRSHPSMHLQNMVEDFNKLMGCITSPFGGGGLRCDFSKLDPALALYMGLKLGQLGRLLSLKVREPEIALGHTIATGNDAGRETQCQEKAKRHKQIQEAAKSIQANAYYRTEDELAKAIKTKLSARENYSLSTIKRALRDMRQHTQD